MYSPAAAKTAPGVSAARGTGSSADNNSGRRGIRFKGGPSFQGLSVGYAKRGKNAREIFGGREIL